MRMFVAAMETGNVFLCGYKQSTMRRVKNHISTDCHIHSPYPPNVNCMLTKD